jgi:L-asparaginase
MTRNKKILILNTGGTFNKVYDQISGELIVPKNNYAIENIIKSSKINYLDIQGLLFKDSLEIKKEDRKILATHILNSQYDKIIIIHGTDTMNKTAKYLFQYCQNKIIILTGSMIPFSLNKIEATSNLMQAIGYIQNKLKNGVYISMHGHIEKHNKIYKNREKGIFKVH